jgi:two-component system, OmpR family, osmolarity sensor histidine kinase EnvZ
MAAMANLWPKSLFARNWLLLLIFAVLVQLSTIATYMLLQRPSMEELGGLIAAQISTLNAQLSHVPIEARAQIAEQIYPQSRIIVDTNVHPPADGLAKGLLLNTFLQTVKSRVPPGIPIRWSQGTPSQLWVELDGARHPYWLVLPIRSLVRSGGLNPTVLLMLAIALMATIVASLIQRRINRPLQEIAAAARKLGEGGRPERLPLYSVSELATVANQFNTMTASLEAMEASRAVMLAGISHDIRTPLTKLRLALAFDQQNQEKAVSQYIDQIDTIIGQFLDYGRIGTDESTLEGDLNTLIFQIAGEFEERGTSFTLDLQRLPLLRFRPVAMSRAIRNLMDNAVKYGVEGLEVRSWHQDHEVTIAILDRGPGIQTSDSKRLLQPFIRADVGRSTVSGTGLGLAIADRFARLHGGRVSLSPRPSGGLEACIRLPCSECGASVGVEPQTQNTSALL